MLCKLERWKESSQAMESDTILCGFQKAESTYGLRCTNTIEVVIVQYLILCRKKCLYGEDQLKNGMRKSYMHT